MGRLVHPVRRARRPRSGAAQKSSSRANADVAALSPLSREAITPFFWYSPTRFSKKFVLPCRLMSSIQSRLDGAHQSAGQDELLREARRRVPEEGGDGLPRQR